MANLSKLQPHEREELIADARAILNSKIWPVIFADMKDEYLTKLIQAEPGTLTAAAAHASIKSLAELEGHLKSYLNDGLIRKHNRS